MAEARRPEAPAGPDSKRALLRGIAIGVAIGLFVAVAVGGNPDEQLHRRVLVLAAVAVTIAVTYGVSAARASRRLANQRMPAGRCSSRIWPGVSPVSGVPRRPAAPSARAGRTAP